MAIADILKDQREELEEGLRGQTLVPREAEKLLQDSSGLIQVVSGVRRCGKSVLIYSFLKGKEVGYVNFDDDRLLNVQPNEILAGLYQVYGKQLKLIFFDEIQNLGHWELFVNRLHRAGFRLFVTGSNAKLLAKELATHLTGRHLTLELFPFSFREFLIARNVQEDVGTTKGRSLMLKYLQEYLQCGGFPEIVMQKEKPLLYLRELYRKIIERDIVSRYNIKYKKTLREIAQTIISNPARYISYGKIRRQFDLGSDHTIKNYLSYLEETYLLLFLSKFSRKPIEIEKSEKKAYSIDTGMTIAVSLQQGVDFGRVYEQVVALELWRRKVFSPDTEIYYWKDSEQLEVDFVLLQGKTVRQLIQVCYDIQNEETKKRELRALMRAGKELRCRHLLIISHVYEGEEQKEWFGIKAKIKYIPLWKWLLRLDS